MWIGPQQYYQGYPHVLGKGKSAYSAYQWRMLHTGTLSPITRPVKTGPRHFNNRCECRGMPRRFYPYGRIGVDFLGNTLHGRSWKNTDRAAYCDQCGRFVRHACSLITERMAQQVDEPPIDKPYHAQKRFCRECVDLRESTRVLGPLATPTWVM